ncbi:MAG: Ig-like domain-containing protein, partial [Pirellulales bacterium]|nr:Ig-like domain-containing protein [Pirellulales bacterium]
GGMGIDTIDGTTDTNTAPTGDIADQSTDEDTSLAIDLGDVFDDVEHYDNELTFTVVGNTNAALVTQADVNGEDLNLAVAADQSGTADITVRATDPLGLFIESTFTLTVLPINDAPFVATLPAPTADEDDLPTNVDLYSVFDDIDNTDGELTFEVISNDNALLFASVTIAAGTLVLTHAANKHGQANVVVRATDPGGLTSDAHIAVTVNPINDPPVIVGINDISVPDTESSTAIDLTSAFSDIDDATLTYTIESNTNAGLFTSTDITSGTLTLNYSGAAGAADITIRAMDAAGDYVDTTFTVTVNAVNDAPAGAIADVNVDEDATDTVIDLLAAFDDVDNADADLTFTVQANTNAALFDAVTVDGVAGTLTLEYAADANGTADITIRATDTGGAYVDVTFAVNVAAVNDTPTIQAINLGPQPAIRNADLTLAAVGVADIDDSVAQVAFYRDADGDGEFDAVSDQLLATDTDGADGWQATVVANFGEGDHTYFAVATDAAGATSDAAAAAGSVDIVGILDNTMPGYAETGTGWTDGSDANSFDGTHRSHAAGTGANTATWEFTGLMNAPHEVQITWAADAANATNATFNIYTGGVLVDTVTVDQTAAPVGETVDGATWLTLSFVNVVDGAITVELSDAANGTVVADAVRLVDPIPTIDSLTVSPAELNTTDSVTLTANNVDDIDGTVEEVRFYRDINDNGVFDTSDQLLATDTDGVDGWSATAAWTTFTGNYTFGDQTYFAIAEDDSGEDSAPVSVTNTIVPIIDDGDGGYAEISGTWTSSTSGHEADSRSSSDSGATAQYTFTGLAPGSYRVSATWVDDAGNTTDAVYTLLDDGTERAAVSIDQQTAPAADKTSGGSDFQYLGSAIDVVGGTLVVQLTNNGGGSLVADAVRLDLIERYPLAIDDSVTTNAGDAVTISVLGNDLDASTVNPVTIEAVEQVSVVGDSVVRTEGALIEAINLGSSKTRTVNGVTFQGKSTRDDLTDSYSRSGVYTDGGVSGSFEVLLDSFSYESGGAGNPGQATVTLTGLTAGKEYLVQLFISDDRSAMLQSRTQSYTINGVETDALENGDSYSLVVRFTATGATQDIDIQSWPGVGESQSSVNVNAFQVRELSGGLSIDSFTQGGDGTVTEQDGQLVYTPTGPFIGVDSFDYTVVDPAGRTSTA